jgi:hypothetical protein
MTWPQVRRFGALQLAEAQAGGGKPQESVKTKAEQAAEP